MSSNIVCNMKKTLIIAEVGVNHNGKMEDAIELIKASAESGADIVKFQTFIPEELVTASAKKANYQKDTTGKSGSQLEMLQKLALPLESFYKLKEYCDNLNIEFLTTSFGELSTDFIIKLNLSRVKIPSGEITNLPYLRKLGSLKKPIILSTGMSEIDEIRSAVQSLTESGASLDDITLLHCISEYPTKLSNANLSCISTLQKEFNTKVGFSDHTIGIDASKTAVALGATIIEKHITLDRKMIGPDHKASMDYKEFSLLVNEIRSVEESLGDGLKIATKEELKNKLVARKSIIARHNIKKNDVFTSKNLITKRPGNGISPMKWDSVLGKISNRDYLADELIDKDVLK